MFRLPVFFAVLAVFAFGCTSFNGPMPLTAKGQSASINRAPASHPHQWMCFVSGEYLDGKKFQFLLQGHTEREYVSGDPNKDVHDYKYQVRVCDDDNDVSQCSTYATTKVSTDPTSEVILTSMKDTGAVFFKGMIDGKKMKGLVVKAEWQGDKLVKSLVAFESKLNTCMSSSWVQLTPESDSMSF